MQSSTPSSVWPPILIGQAATLQALLVEFEANERRDADGIAREQYAQLAVLAAYAARHSPFFRQRLARANLSAKDLSGPEALRKLPPLTRREVQESGDDLHCAIIPKTHLPHDVARSSGSTGEPVAVRKTALNQLFFQANMMREHIWHKRDTTQRLMVVRGMIKEKLGAPEWGPPVSFFQPTGKVMALPVGTEPAELARHILDFRPYHLNIYPNLLENLIDYCKAENIRIDSVRHIWTISEMLKPDARARFAQFFGASIEDDYSCNEIGILALQCPESGLYHEMSESVIIEILDDKGKPCRAGETGRVVVTDLHNFATPLVRYEVGDYAVRGGACSCGRGLPTIVSIVGRKRNLSLHPDGTRRQPALTLAVFKSQLPIRQFQLIQHRLDDLEMRLVTPRLLTAEEEKTLEATVQEALRYPAPLRYTYIEGRIPLPQSGKFEDFICHA